MADETWHEANAFLKAIRAGRWERVTTEGDFGRILEIFNATIDSDGDGCLIRFALRGSPTRILWADVELTEQAFCSPTSIRRMPPGLERLTGEWSDSSLLKTRTRSRASCGRADPWTGHGS